MISQIVKLQIRNDDAGLGHFGAPRGSRTHRGIDFECVVDMPVVSPVRGVITRHGYCYNDDLSWRYVEVTDILGQRHRLFYVSPLVIAPLGHSVGIGTIIGDAQDITQRYPGKGMLPHIHYEIKDQMGVYLDPEKLTNGSV